MGLVLKQLCAAVILLGTVSFPAWGQSKCGVMQISHFTSTPVGAWAKGKRAFSASLTQCTGMAYGRVDNCHPGSAASSRLDFSATNTDSPVGSANDYCRFSCMGPASGGCSFVVNLEDGLPVELMGFDIK